MAFAVYQLLSGNLITAVWYFLIGTFLREDIRMSYEQVLLSSTLAGESVRRLCAPIP